jgi:hypothetical protein
LWNIALPSKPVFGPALWQQHMVLAATDAIEVRSLISGELVWSVPVKDCLTPPVIIKDYAALVCNGGELLVLDLRNQKHIQIPGANASVPPFSVTPDNLIFLGDKDLLLLDLGSGTTSRWYGPVHWLGPVCTPLVMLDHQLYFGSTNKGVVCLRPKKQ